VNYRLAVLTSSLVLIGLGLWFSASHAVDYLNTTNFVNTEGSWRDSDGDGYLELNVCSRNGCSPWVDVQNYYMNKIIVGAIIVVAGACALAFLFAYRKHTKAKSIV
jgi:hypothetical protein